MDLGFVLVMKQKKQITIGSLVIAGENIENGMETMIM